MSDVLPELIIEIFSHLPVKSLLRFRDLNDCPGNFATGYASALSNVFVDDSLHWLVDNDGPGIVQISAFHLGIEEYRVVQLPDCRFFDMNCVTNMGNLRGKLCLLSGYDKSSLDIWVMNSYEDGNQVILHQAGGEKLVWCDIRQRTGEAKEIHGIPRFWQFFQHVESLVKLPNDSSTKNRDDSLSKRFKTVVLIK
ncbi:hypothetical protein POM88_010612 [Heracleum sosnowskyi]|uniref:F-box associated domain-containing protein n=1 Tax=Heracleum sosnowskyi TaxID=360622 RepID=A0AAD8IVG4_9APIA|nr:hypothetical protein POM88_010612 [Heracleum sosnowskyi]